MSSDDHNWDDLEDPVQPSGLRLPNYTRRRMTAVGVMITILILVGAAGWLATRTSGDAFMLTTPQFNGVIEASRSTGDLELLDVEGNPIATATGQGLTSAVFTFEDRLGLLGPREITLRSSDLNATTAALTLALEPQWSLQRLHTQRSLTFLASPNSPGNLILIDGVNGTVLDVGAVAGQRSPVLFPDSLIADYGHRIFALGDGRNFQTIVVGFDLPTAAFFPGVPVAISPEVVVTATTVGQSSELGVFSVDGQRLNSISTDRPIGALLAGRELLLVSPAGEVRTVNVDSGEITMQPSLNLPIGEEVVWVKPGLDAQRLIVAGRRSFAILDPSGAVVSQQSFSSPRELDPAWVTWKCWPVGSREDMHSLVDLFSGETVALVNEDPEIPRASSTRLMGVNADGCALHLAGPEGQSILTPTTRVPVPITVTRVTLSPDAKAALMVTNDGRARLITLPEPDQLNGLLANGVDLGIRRGILAFTNR